MRETEGGQWEKMGETEGEDEGDGSKNVGDQGGKWEKLKENVGHWWKN